MRIGSTVSDLGKYNENAVIHALRRIGQASQGDLTAATGLSVQTVSMIVKNLTGRGYLREVKTVSAGRGRPRVILDLVPSARHSMGLHVDPTVMTAVVLDLKGQVLDSAASDAVDPKDPHGSLREAAHVMRGLIDASGVADSLVGACLAVPGPLDLSGSMVESVWMPAWTGVPLGPVLEESLNMDVPVVKDTLAAVIGESWVRARETLDSTLIFIYVGTGTGVGIALNGEPVRGFSGNAGEIGQMLLSLAGGTETGLENDPVVMVEAAHAAGVLSGDAPKRGDLVATERGFRELCALAHAGDGGAEAILRGAASRIAKMVVMATELLDAETVVFGGPYWDLVSSWYLPAAENALRAPSARGPHPVRALSSAMGPQVGAIGAASVVLDARYVPRYPRALRNLGA